MDASNYNNYNYNNNNNFTSQSLATRVNQANKAINNLNSIFEGVRLTLVVGLVASVALAIFASIAIGVRMMMAVVGIGVVLSLWAQKNEREVEIFKKALQDNEAISNDVKKSGLRQTYEVDENFIKVRSLEDNSIRICRVYKAEKDTPGWFGPFTYQYSRVKIS